MITPQTHPSYFRDEAVGPLTYSVYVYHSIGLDDDIQATSRRYWRDAYKSVRPEELKDGKIVEDKYKTWIIEDTDEDGTLNSGATKAIANLLFIPKNGAPPIDSDDAWYVLSSEQLARVRSFTKPTSPDSTNGQATSAVSTTASPDSVTA